MIYVFYNNDPLAQDLGGGAEHFRGLYRALTATNLKHRLIGARLQDEHSAAHVEYISKGSSFLRFYIALWAWFAHNRHRFTPEDVFHFHRNYAAWPKLVFAPRKGSVMVSYHNVTGRVLEHWLGRLAMPVRALMLRLERRVAKVADAIVCVSRRDSQELARLVAKEPFASARVIPAAYDDAIFKGSEATPAAPEQAKKLLILGRLSHQKNVPLAIEVLEHLVAADDGYTLTIAGRGEGAKEIMRRVAASPAAPRIRWIGAVPHGEVPALLADHGILLLTSRYEASPTVVKEALRARRPVVSTDVGDVTDWLDEDKTGFVCRPDAAELAQSVRRATRLIEDQRYSHTDRLKSLNERQIMGEVMDLYRFLASKWA